jgi:hypothetical protein
MRINGIYVPDDLEFEMDENGELIEVKKEITQTEPDIDEELLVTYKYRIPRMLYSDLIWLDGVLTRAHEIKDDYYNYLLNEVRELVKRQIPIRLEQDKKQKEKEAREEQEEKERQQQLKIKRQLEEEEERKYWEEIEEQKHREKIKKQKEKERQEEIDRQVERERQHLERNEVIYKEEKNYLTGATRFIRL